MKPRLALGLLALIAPTSLAAQSPFDPIAFMSGCWQGSFGDGGIIEEHYTKPSSNLMLGTTRYLQGGATVQFEFTQIEATEEGLVLTPYPDGRPSPDPFTLSGIDDQGRAIFEAPEHDYPKRIVYAPQADGTILAWIDGGADDPQPRRWHLSPVACMPDA